MPKGQGAGKDFQVYLAFETDDKRKLRKLKEHNAVSAEATGGDWAVMNVLAECESGVNFKILIKDLLPTDRPSDRAVCVTVHIDGRHVEDRILSGTHKSWTISTIDIRRDGKRGTYPLCFAPIETVSIPQDADMGYVEAQGLSCVLVQLEYGTMSLERERAYSPRVFEEAGTAYEEDAKMGCRTTGGKDARTTVASRGTACTFVEADRSYFYEFRIKYGTAAVNEKLRNEVAAAKTVLVSESPQSRSTTSTHTVSNIAQSSSSSRDFPPLAKRDKKRPRPPSPAPCGSGSSGGSFTAGSDSSGDEKLAELLRTLTEKKKVKRKEKKDRKVMRQEEKESAKRKKREENAESRKGKERQYAIDLTGDTDDEGADPSVSVSGRVKQDVVKKE